MKRCWKAVCLILVVVTVMQAAAVCVSALSNLTLEPVDTSLSTEPTAPYETAVPAEETVPATIPEAETIPAETVPAETVGEAEAPKLPNDVPLYFQTDYPDTLYGNGTIESSGCGITSLAMVATFLTGHEYLPDELADYFGGYIGNNMERLEYASDMLQLPWEKAENFHVALQALKEGNVVIALMNGRSMFTDSQHFIVLTGVNEDGKILVNDPYEPNYSRWYLENAFEEGFKEGDISRGYSGSWIYKKTDMPEDPFIYIPEETPYIEPRYPDIELTKEETELLARMLWVEARGETFEGQQAIAEVVLNRMAASNFPDTLNGVIYAEGQFRSVDFLEDAKPTQTQYEAIEAALYGPYVLPMDVVFFATYPVNENVWGEIGGHTFCHQW